MAELGQVYRAVYTAKNYATGVAGITVSVRLPDGTTDGPFAMTELPAPFLGTYFYDYSTSVADPQGVYVFQVTSVNEGNHKSSKTENFLPAPAGGGGGLTLDQVRALINSALGREKTEVIVDQDPTNVVEVEQDEEQEMITQADTGVELDVESDTSSEVEVEVDEDIIVEV
ncbi:MAG: hypothetical protein ACXABY_06955 [Candidatus Thorarchaeota archaeon]|jgi:hypothetical protein